MGKISFKTQWEKIKTQLIDKNVRDKAFIFLSTFIFSFIAVGCTIVNFITKEMTLAYVSLGCFIAFEILLWLEFFLFSKKRSTRDIPIMIAMVVLILTLTFAYVFLAPADSLYIFWICIIPIAFCLSFGLKRGLLGSLALIVAIAIVFYVPGLYHLTKTEDIEAHWLIKVFFLIYYLMCTTIGASLAYVNTTAIKKLDELKDQYYIDANTDNLTGLRNQAYYITYVNSLYSTVEKGETIGLMFIDIDDFKIYNDKYGHEVGNEVLKTVATKLNEIPHALCVRWGGDEFAIVERNITKDEFIAKANYLLKSVEGSAHGVTISIGLAYYIIDDDFDFQKIFNEADMQAIRAKGKGKNCIIIN